MHIKYVFVLKTTYLIMRACANICQEAWQVLARLADIRQAVLRGLTNICRAVSRGLAELANIRQTIYRVLARLPDICQRPFLRKM
jgi:hypothetical protein